MHQPVLLDETVRLLAVKPGGVYVDGTVGSGGHARALLQCAGPMARLLAIDRDADAIARARENLREWATQCIFENGNYADMAEIASRHGIERVDGIVLDLGVSSEELTTAERGFSLSQSGPLDMRMDRSQRLTAAELVRSLTEEELTDLLRNYGEEPFARRIARAIVYERNRAPIETTSRLAEVVQRAKRRSGRIHPATQTFQALRIAVNDELGSLQRGLPAALELLAIDARMAVISFHSLEDRIVKMFFREHVVRWEALAGGGRERIVRSPEVLLINRKPIVAAPEELGANPRARSAKLRVAERKT